MGVDIVDYWRMLPLIVRKVIFVIIAVVAPFTLVPGCTIAGEQAEQDNINALNQSGSRRDDPGLARLETYDWSEIGFNVSVAACIAFALYVFLYYIFIKKDKDNSFK